MNICEWKDGKLELCEEMAHYIEEEYYAESPYTGNYCRFCGTDIRKPELTEPLIVKSGGTWVVNYGGVDYLCVTIFPYEFKMDKKQFLFQLNDRPGTWKSFTGPNPDITELTDEIAKLRPMVHNGRNTKVYEKLIYVQENGPTDDRYIYHTANGVFEYQRLATAEELQDQS